MVRGLTLAGLAMLYSDLWVLGKRIGSCTRLKPSLTLDSCNTIVDHKLDDAHGVVIYEQLISTRTEELIGLRPSWLWVLISRLCWLLFPRIMS